MRRLPPWLIAALVSAEVALPAVVHANGDHASAPEPPTRFERFTLSACSPCVREFHPVTTLSIAPFKLPAFPRAVAGAAARPGEIAIEVLRAHQLGRPGWQSLAMRVSLSVVAGGGGELYRLAVGLLDADEVPALAAAVSDMARVVAAPSAGQSETVDIDFHGGSLRIGVLRLRGDTVVYVQAGDLLTLMQREVWEVPTSLYLPVKDLPALAAAFGQAAATIDKVRRH